MGVDRVAANRATDGVGCVGDGLFDQVFSSCASAGHAPLHRPSIFPSCPGVRRLLARGAGSRFEKGFLSHASILTQRFNVR
jgi:hypothetical protein